MLKINLSPVNSNHIPGVKPLNLNWNAPVLTVVSGMESGVPITNQSFDLSEIPDGATVNDPFLTVAERTGNDYEITVALPIGANPSQEACFPEPVIMNSNGAVPLPDVDLN